MKKRIPYILSLILLLAGFAVSVPVPELQAQQQGGTMSPRMINRDLRVLKQRITAASELLRQFPNEQAKRFLEEADKLYKRAVQLARENRLTQAKGVIDQATALINKALGLALQNPVRRLVSQLDELMRRAENIRPGMRSTDIERLLQRARRNRQDAERAAHRGDFVQAMEYYRVAISLAQKALDYGGMTSAQSVDYSSEKARFQTMAERARAAIEASKNKAAHAIYEQAMRQAHLAETSLNSGNRAMALSHYNSAIKLMLRAFDLASKNSPADINSLRAEYETIQSMIQTARERQSTQSDPRLRTMLTRAEQSLARARTAVENGRPESARLHLNLARGFLNTLFRDRGAGPASRQRIDQELRNLKIDIELASDVLQGAQNAQAGDLVRMADRFRQQAENDIEQGRQRIALQKILVAQRFLSQAERSRRGDASRRNRLTAENQVRRLEQLLAEATDLMAGQQATPFMREMLLNAEKMRRQARDMLARGRYALAYELADVGIEFAKKALQNR